MAFEPTSDMLDLISSLREELPEIPKEVDNWGIFSLLGVQLVRSPQFDAVATPMILAYAQTNTASTRCLRNYILLRPGDVALYDATTYAQYLFLNVLLNEMAEENQEATDFISELIKKLFPSVYNCVKRFRSLCILDLFSMYAEELSDARAMAVALTLCYLRNIQLDADCIRLCEKMNQIAKKAQENRPLNDPTRLRAAQNRTEVSLDRLTRELESFDKGDAMRHQGKYAILQQVCIDYHLDDGFIAAICENQSLYETALSDALTSLYYWLPNAEPSMDELVDITFAHLYFGFLSAQINGISSFVSQFFALYMRRECLPPRGTARKPVPTPAPVPEPTTEALSESVAFAEKTIADLKEKLRLATSANKELHQATKELQDVRTELATVKQQMEKEQSELVALREYVYHLTQEDTDTASEASLKEQERAIREKRVIIIGGHSNWTYKLKNKFPKWKFLLPGPTGTVDASIVSRADYVYFFTDFIKHATYNRYIGALREAGGISYGYLHTVHVEANIQQIYRDLFLSDEQ